MKKDFGDMRETREIGIGLIVGVIASIAIVASIYGLYLIWSGGAQ